MKNSKHCKEGNAESIEDILRLLHHLVNREDGKHVSSDHFKVDGSNVGAVMNVRQSSPIPDCCINIYVSNNIQGVNNSILVGSEVKMGEPGVGLSFGDVKWEKDRSKMDKINFPHSFRSKAVFLCALVLLISLLFALFQRRRT